jgi:hypothetical protein
LDSCESVVHLAGVARCPFSSPSRVLGLVRVRRPPRRSRALSLSFSFSRSWTRASPSSNATTSQESQRGEGEEVQAGCVSCCPIDSEIHLTSQFGVQHSDVQSIQPSFPLQPDLRTLRRILRLWSRIHSFLDSTPLFIPYNQHQQQDLQSKSIAEQEQQQQHSSSQQQQQQRDLDRVLDSHRGLCSQS